MGSGSSRKSSDSPIIRTPKQEHKGGSGRGSGGGSRPDKVADMCIQSFELVLKDNSILKADKTLTLQKEKSRLYSVWFLNKQVGELNKKISDMIDACSEMSISYQGTVIKKKNEEKLYGRFVRK